MFERFTDRARKVMALANQEAQRFNHEYIGTEHILLGLVKEGSGVGANVLKNLDVDLRKVRLEVEKLRRAEGEWLQVLVRVLDHVYALHLGALRSGQPNLIEQLSNFQNACRDAARRGRPVTRVMESERSQTVLIGVVEGVSPSMEEAAQTLRADRWRVFADVSLPLMRPRRELMSPMMSPENWSGGTVTTRPLLANGDARSDRLMPFVQNISASETLGMIVPPAHMQKV